MRKQIGMTFIETEKILQILFELSPETILIMNRKGIILDVNMRLYDWLGYKPEEVIGENILELPFLPEESRKQVIEKFCQQSIGNIISRHELGFLTKSGRECIGRITTNPVRDKNGKMLQNFVMISDITEYKRLEKALRESLEMEAQAYNQGRIEIADTVLHNIGNAINSVTVGIGTIQENLVNSRLIKYLYSLANVVEEHQEDFSDYVKNDPQGQKVAPFIIALAQDFAKHNEGLAKTANRISERARHIGDIIQIDKAFCNRITRRKYTNPRKVVHDAVAMLRNSIGEKTSILIDCDNVPREVNIQEDKLRQALMNLIRKAIEATNQIKLSGDLDRIPFIKIRCFAESSSLVLEVTHNGISIKKHRPIERDVVEKSKKAFIHSSTIDEIDANFQIYESVEGIDRSVTMRVVLPLNTASHLEY